MFGFSITIKVLSTYSNENFVLFRFCHENLIKFDYNFWFQDLIGLKLCYLPTITILINNKP